MAFDSTKFIAGFERQLKHLVTSEKITKALLQTMSRDLLALLHTKNEKQGDIGYINRTIAALTPMNRAMFIEFTKRFTGFIMNDGETAFIKKSKKHYDAVQAEALEWLEDPMNNIWSWADRHIEPPKAKEFGLDAIKKATENMLKKAEKNHISKAEVFGAIIAGGFTIAELVECMVKLDKMDDVMHEVETNYIEGEAPAQRSPLPDAPF